MFSHHQICRGIKNDENMNLGSLEEGILFRISVSTGTTISSTLYLKPTTTTTTTTPIGNLSKTDTNLTSCK